MNSMDTLRQHLRRLKADADAAAANAPDLDEARRLWLDDLQRLMADLHDWLRVAEGEGLLQIVHEGTTVEEAKYRTYDAPAMIITAPGRGVHVHPVGLDIAGCAGRVDLDCGPRKVRLLRQGDRSWVIARSSRGSRLTLEHEALDAQSFAAALDDLLALDDPHAG
jgi:hypothetical protein